MRTVLGSILRAAGNSGNVCLGPSLRNHGLITGLVHIAGKQNCPGLIVTFLRLVDLQRLLDPEV